MYAGRIVERAGQRPVRRPEHPYTWGLLGSIPRLDSPARQDLVPIAGRPPSPDPRPPGCAFQPAARTCAGALRIDPVLEPAATRSAAAGTRWRACWRTGASCGPAAPGRPEQARAGSPRVSGPCSRSATSSSTSRSRGGVLQRRSAPCTRSTACRSTCSEGETLGLVGESGCGKSHDRAAGGAAARAHARVDPVRRARHHARRGASSRLRRDVQMIFQDPYSSLNPRRPSARSSASRS